MSRSATAASMQAAACVSALSRPKRSTSEMALTFAGALPIVVAVAVVAFGVYWFTKKD